MNMYNIDGLTYTPQTEMGWFTRAMFGGRLVSGGYVRVLTGIKGDELLTMIDLENKILQIDGKDCAWTPNQIIKLSEKVATIKTYKINLEECIDTLENKRTNYMLSAGANNVELPSELEDATLTLISIGLSNEIEEMLIGGSVAANPNEFNGLERTLILSNEAAHLVGSTITAANVLDKIAAVYGAFTEDVLQAEDAGNLVIFCSYNTRRLARTALSVLTNQVLYPLFSMNDTDKRNPQIFYNSIELVPVKGIGKDTLIGIETKNFILTTDLEGDLENVELGQFPKPNDNKVFIKGRLRLGCVIPFEGEAVIMATAITVAQAADDNSGELRLVPNSLVFSAAGETKTATVITKDTTATISISSNPAGFTITKGTTTAGVTTLSIVATANTGNLAPRTGQIVVTIDDTNRRGNVTLDQHNEEVIEIED